MNQEFIKSVTTDSVKENEFLAYLCLSKNNVKKLQNLVKQGMPLTAFVLTLMEHYNCSKKNIKKTVSAAVNIDKDVFYWLKSYFETDEIIDIFKKFEDKLYRFVSNEDCIKFELWNILLKRGAYHEVAQNAPEVLLAAGPDRGMIEALLKVDFAKYVDLAYEKGMYFQIFCAKDGWKYLVDKKLIKYVITSAQEMPAFFSLDEIKEYCYQQGYIDELYEAGSFDFLLEKEEFDVFIKNHSLNDKFLSQHPEKVDWEGLWQHYEKDPSGRQKLKKLARANLNLQVCYEFLWNHSGLFEMLLLLNR